MPQRSFAAPCSRPLSRSRGRWAGALIVATALLGCDRGADKTAATAPPVSVVVSPARLEDIASQRLFTGRVEAIDKVNIRARVQGFLKSRNFEEGSEVKKDALLYEIERDPFQVSLDQAQANLLGAQAALTLAEQSFARAQDLATRGSGTVANLDSARSTLVQAQGTLKARQADVQTAELNLGYTRITAPMDGKIGRSAFSVGNLVGTDSGTLVTLVAQDPMYVTFPVPQWLLLQVRKAGDGPESVVVKLRLADGALYDQSGEISFSDVTATAATDSVLIRAKIPNPQRLLIDQQLVSVLVVRKRPEQKLLISQSALILDQQGPYVLVVDADNKVAIKRIKIGEQRDTWLVVESGLSPGDRTIVAGQQKARPGLVVAPQPADSNEVKGTGGAPAAPPAAAPQKDATSPAATPANRK